MVAMPTRYRIQVQGRLPEGVAREFPAMTVRTDKRLTTVCGPLPDTAALYGLIGRLEALGLVLVTVRSLPDIEGPGEQKRIDCRGRLACQRFWAAVPFGTPQGSAAQNGVSEVSGEGRSVAVAEADAEIAAGDDRVAVEGDRVHLGHG